MYIIKLECIIAFPKGQDTVAAMQSGRPSKVLLQKDEKLADVKTYHFVIKKFYNFLNFSLPVFVIVSYEYVHAFRVFV